MKARDRVCVCVCVRERERERKKERINHLQKSFFVNGSKVTLHQNTLQSFI